ncbi:MAG TPA: hypothetical protein VFC09_09830 [Candidatus Dormibacteraeota bacterium]|nr:hypothetical protein [Candidatus Dormibacteraeota bacterium]
MKLVITVDWQRSVPVAVDEDLERRLTAAAAAREKSRVDADTVRREQQLKWLNERFAEIWAALDPGRAGRRRRVDSAQRDQEQLQEAVERQRRRLDVEDGHLRVGALRRRRVA